MKTEFWVIGKTKQDFIKEGISFFLKRLKPFIQFSYHEIDIKKGNSEQEILQNETDAVLKLINKGDYIILLEETGEQYTSLQFSEYFKSLTISITGRLIFIAGGAYGFSDVIRQKGHKKLSLSKYTFTHELVRLIFLEQFYRIQTIIKNHPYHH